MHIPSEGPAGINYQGYRAPLTAATMDMSVAPPRRKVLIIEDDPSSLNLLYVLLGGLNYDGEVALSGEHGLEMIERESFDAVLLDLRHSSFTAAQMISRITDIRPSLMGRILIMARPIDSPETRKLVDPRCSAQITQNRMMVDVHRSLRSLWSQT